MNRRDFLKVGVLGMMGAVLPKPSSLGAFGNLNTIYRNCFQTQADVDDLNVVSPELQGTLSLDTANPLFGKASLKVVTNSVAQPYYGWIQKNHEYIGIPNRLEVMGALKTNIDTFGIGWVVIQNNQVAVMYIRLNFVAGTIQLLSRTTPHIWETLAPLPYNVRRDGILQPFRMWIETDPSTFTYKKFGLHAFCREAIPNRWEWNLNNVHIPDNTPNPQNTLIPYINPQGRQGVAANAWIAEVKAFTI